MRILIHDFAGHPFQAQLSRELSERGHHVVHAYLAGLQGPKGRLEKSAADSSRLTITGIRLSKSLQKYSPIKRFISHREYARELKRLIGRSNFDIVVSGNTPIDIQAELLWHCRQRQIGFVHWIQDVYCRAIEFVLRRKLKAFGGLLSYPFRKLERAVAAYSDATIVIAPAFRDLLIDWGIPEARITVIENWAPLDELACLPRSNSWSDKHDLTDKTVFLYSGTLGLKHRPDLLYRLAESLESNCRLVVVSEGVGREYLERQPKLETLSILNFQPFGDLPSVLASADVLIATLERDAGDFAVPSKILSYLCAGRAILLAAPRMNLGSQIVERSMSGLVADPDKEDEWLAQAGKLSRDAGLRAFLGAQGRRYAEQTFAISRIAAAFEDVFQRSRSCQLAVDSAGAAKAIANS